MKSFWKLRFTSVALLCIVNTGCSAQNDSKLWKQDDKIYLFGPINAEMADFTHKSIDSNIKTIIIRSKGGSVSEALKIANDVLRNKLNVVVDLACFSACATVILPAGYNRAALSNSLIVLHTTQYGFRESYLLAANKRLAKNQLPALVALDGHGEAEVLKIRNIKLDLLLLPYIARGLKCLTSYKTDEGLEVFTIGFYSSGVAPSPEVFSRLGMHVEGLFNKPDDISNFNKINKFLHPINYVTVDDFDIEEISKIFYRDDNYQKNIVCNPSKSN